jgi:hypothetical protein
MVNMNKINKLARTLPSDEHDFQIDTVGAVSKKRYLGEFRCRIPTIKDQCHSAKHEAFLNGENGPFLPPGILKANKMIAYLRFTLIDIPKFWRESDMGYDLRDMNVVEAVYDAVIKFENEWVDMTWGDPRDEEPKEEGTTEAT